MMKAIISKMAIVKMKVVGLIISGFIGKISLIKLKFIALATLGLSNLIPGIMKLMFQFFGTIMNGIAGLFDSTFSSLGGAISEMFQSFGFSTAQYGLLGPTMFVGGLGIAFLVGYLLLIPGDAEKDVVQAEDEA
jgi:hypothetical protein